MGSGSSIMSKLREGKDFTHEFISGAKNSAKGEILSESTKGEERAYRTAASYTSGQVLEALTSFYAILGLQVQRIPILTKGNYTAPRDFKSTQVMEKFKEYMDALRDKFPNTFAVIGGIRDHVQNELKNVYSNKGGMGMSETSHDLAQKVLKTHSEIGMYKIHKAISQTIGESSN